MNAEFENMKKRIDDLQFGPEGRTNSYAKSMLKVEGRIKERILLTVLPILFEKMYPEENKRKLFRRLKEAEKTGEKLDASELKALMTLAH